MPFFQRPRLQADQDTREARHLAHLMLHAAENSTDDDFHRLRGTYITLLYVLIEKLQEAETCIDLLQEQNMGAIQ